MSTIDILDIFYVQNPQFYGNLALKNDKSTRFSAVFPDFFGYRTCFFMVLAGIVKASEAQANFAACGTWQG